MRKTIVLASLGLLGAVTLGAGEKGMMHCFAYTVIETASDADWKAFHAATDALPSKMSGIVKRVWVGPLRAPLNIFNTDAETRKKVMAGEEKVAGPIVRVQRKSGVCMELADEGSLKGYAAHPYHAEWMAAYEKVRVAGTTTFDILGK